MNKKQIFVFAFLAVVIFVLGAQAATAQPVSLRVGNTVIQFFPLILSSRAAEAPPGVLYVFSSTATTDGSAGGRDDIGDICPTEDTGSHFCSLQEIENAWATTGVYFSNPFTKSWVDNPDLLGTLYPDSNGDPRNSDWPSVGEYGNCGSWSQDFSGAYGSVIDVSAVNVYYSDCDISLPVACCKQMP
jgi:hypothetical protein